MSVWWYLFAPLLLMNGDPTPSVAFPYPTEELCQEALEDSKTEIGMDAEIIDGFWVCIAVEFDPSRYDRPPEPAPSPPPRHIPGKDEARACGEDGTVDEDPNPDFPPPHCG